MPNLSSTTSPGDTAAVSFARKGYDFLLGQILAGHWPPGEEINRRLVAEQLGMSLAPVNEAITQLQVEGYLEVSPRRQTRVRVIRREEVRGLLILREAIECQAARLYCGEPVIRNKKRLASLAAAVDKTRAGSRENEDAECALHAALIELVASPLLLDEFHKVMRRRLFYMINRVMPGREQLPLDNHRRLLRKLESTDPDTAESAMRLHLERGREGILRPEEMTP